jgi:hypothetical protein
MNPTLIFAMVVAINVLNFIDRGIVPGATVEFNAFIQGLINTSEPDVYLGFVVENLLIRNLPNSIYRVILYCKLSAIFFCFWCHYWLFAVRSSSAYL